MKTQKCKRERERVLCPVTMRSAYFPINRRLCVCDRERERARERGYVHL